MRECSPIVGEDRMKDMKPLSRQTVGKSAAIRNRLRRKAVAKNLAIGMKPEEALLEAGYSPTTARKKAYQIIRHPVVQSLLTESCERVLQKQNKSFDDLLKPFVKALDATVVVKMPAAEGAVQTTVVDHSTRMAAAEHLIGLYRAKGNDVQEGDAREKGPPVLLQINFIKSPKDKDTKSVGLPLSGSRQVLPEQGDVSVPQVSFVQSKRRP